MRRVVVQDDLREALIRPDQRFVTYIGLMESDLQDLVNEADFIAVEYCPGCGHVESKPDFEKMGMQYVQCLKCGTSYVSPRPSKDDLDRFYEESEAVKYWNSTLVESTAEARRQYIFGPRASWVLETASTYEKDQGTFIDFYSKYPVYLEEIASRGNFSMVFTRRSMVQLGEQITIEDIGTLGEENVAVVSAFEVIERLFDPFAFMNRMNQVLEPGGLIFLTTLSISGFDLSLLRGKARNLLPPTHLTLLSYSGIQSMIDRSGFEIVEFSTPGRLDVALVLDAIERDESFELPPVINSILLNRGERTHEAFQDFLQQANMSSHVWIAARKKSR